jgi:hypothetical protein
MNALQTFSIFEETDERLPVRPVRTERDFGEKERVLSASGIKDRIDQLVLHGDSTVGSQSAAPASDTWNEAADTAERKVKRILDVPKPTSPLFFTSTFTPVQEWEGYVRAFSGESMSADLVDITAHAKRITQQAEIPLAELSEIDREKLRIGAIFRWAIGYQRTSRGTKMRVSNIVFRDLPRWTRKDLREARQEAAELEEYFRSGRPDLSSADSSAETK